MWPLDGQPRRGWTMVSATLAKPLVQFALAGVVALLVLSTILTAILSQTGTSEAISNARYSTRLVAQDVIMPNLTDALLDGDQAAQADFNRIIRQRVLDSWVVRVKLWTSRGQIVYSDEPRLIGRTFALEQDQMIALSTGKVVANLTDLSSPEN